MYQDRALAADNHYPTGFWDDIAACQPPVLKDAILLCWSTPAKLVNTGREPVGEPKILIGECSTFHRIDSVSAMN